MSLAERAGLALLRQVDPERAHGLALKALRAGLAPLPGPVTAPRLATKLAGLSLPNPIGMAAGFDKNAEAITPLSRAGFGFMEVGAATPRPQSGNPRPRLFRLHEDGAVINRFGFNNDGARVIAERLAAAQPQVPVGLNLGTNKDSADRVGDYCTVLKQTAPYLDFATVNVSSPNTEKLRDLQGADALRAVLERVMVTRGALEKPLPIFLKVAPDLTDADIALIAQTALETGVDALIATNTTLGRENLKSAARDEAGGLSGAPLFAKATRVLARFSMETDGALPLIGVGGIASAEQAYTKITAGASALQLYTALAYQGLSLVRTIAEGVDSMLARDGHAHLRDAVGSDRFRWIA